MNDNNDTFFLPEYSYKILKSIAKSEKIEDFKISTTDGSSKGENFLGVISRVKIEGIKNGKKENVYLILKTPPVFDKSIRDKMLLNAYYRREVYAYNVVLPAFSKVEDEASILEEDKFKSAKCFTATSDDMSEILVFEDLNVQGFKMFNRHESFDYDHMLLIVRTLAKYHALSFAMKERYPKKFSQFSDNTFKKEDLGDVFSKMYYESVDKAIGMMENSHLAERLRAYAKDSYEKLADFLVLPDDSEDTKYGVIGHGDCWCNNFLFKYEENKPTSVILVDWQIIKFASPITDLAYLIFTSTDEEFRSEHFDDIMDVYYDSLSARLSLLGCDARQCFPEEIFKQHQRKYLLSGLLMSIIVLPLSQGNKSEAVDLTDMIGANEMNTDKIIVSEDCVRRLNGVVKDFVKYGLI